MDTGGVGFIGLGAMGQGMARNLLDQQPGLRVWNRDAGKTRALVAAGAVAVTSAAAAAAGGIVISMVSDDAALAAVVEGPDGVLGALGPGGIHVSCSTVAPATLERLATLHAARGEVLVAAPVFGRPEAAAARRLWVLLAGPDDATARVRPLLEAISAGIHPLGERLGAAAAMKLAGNFMILSAVEAMGEAMLVAERHGVDRVAFADFFGRTLFAGPVYQNYGLQIASRRYRPAGFRLPLGLKDVRLVREAAGAVKVPMPLADLLANRLIEALAKGREQLDWAALELGIANAAGEEPPISGSDIP